MSIKKEDVMSTHTKDGTPDNFYMSLSKIVGKKVIDVEGYITDEGWGATFKVCNIVFENGDKLGVGGEHDCPYVEDMNEELLEELNGD